MEHTILTYRHYPTYNHAQIDRVKRKALWKGIVIGYALGILTMCIAVGVLWK